MNSQIDTKLYFMSVNGIPVYSSECSCSVHKKCHARIIGDCPGSAKESRETQVGAVLGLLKNRIQFNNQERGLWSHHHLVHRVNQYPQVLSTLCNTNVLYFVLTLVILRWAEMWVFKGLIQDAFLSQINLLIAFVFSHFLPDAQREIQREHSTSLQETQLYGTNILRPLRIPVVWPL